MIRRFLRSDWWAYVLPIAFGLNSSDAIMHALQGRYWFAVYNVACAAIVLGVYILNWRIRYGRHRKSSTPPASNAASGASTTRFHADPSTAGSAVARINAEHKAPRSGPSLGPYRDGIIKQLTAELTHECLVIQALLMIEAGLRQRGHGAGIGEIFMVHRTNSVPPMNTFQVVCGRDPTPLPTSKIEFGEIEGYRCWLVHKGRLLSLYAPVEWPVDQPLKSKIEDHYLTAGGGGIHAFKEAHSAALYAHQYAANYPEDLVAFGKVRLFGEVIEHESGYRAEFARVASIDCLIPGSSVDNERSYGQARILRQLYCPARGSDGP